MMPIHGLGIDAQMMIEDADPDVIFLQQLHCNGLEPEKWPHPNRLTRMSGGNFLRFALA